MVDEGDFHPQYIEQAGALLQRVARGAFERLQADVVGLIAEVFLHLRSSPGEQQNIRRSLGGRERREQQDADNDKPPHGNIISTGVCYDGSHGNKSYSVQ